MDAHYNHCLSKDYLNLPNDVAEQMLMHVITHLEMLEWLERVEMPYLIWACPREDHAYA